MAAAAEKPTLSLDYSAVMSITLSWDKVRGLKDYEQEAGRLVYMTYVYTRRAASLPNPVCARY